MMALLEAISNLNAATSSSKLELYTAIDSCLSEKNIADVSLQEKDVSVLYSEIVKDISAENSELQCLLIKILQSLVQKKEQLLNAEQKKYLINVIINLMSSNQDESIILNTFHFLIQILSCTKIDNLMLKVVLEKIEEFMFKSGVSVSVYFASCNCLQRLVKEYVSEAVNIMPLIIKLIFVPLTHPSTKVREVAEKTLDLCPTHLMSSEENTSFLLKFVKESLAKELLVLFKDNQELYVMKIWSTIVTVIGKNLHPNLTSMTQFFQVIEKGFKSSSDSICIAAFVSWKSLISNFALSEDVLNDSKKLRFVLKPFKNISRLSENVLFTVCDTWWHLIWNLSRNLSVRFTEVCVPLLELTVGKSSNGISEKPIPKSGIPSLIKRGCFILLLLLQPTADAVNCISSPKKMPPMQYSCLQTSIDVKILVHHFKDIINATRVIVETFGKKDDMKTHLDCLMKSILFIVSFIIEDEGNKESVDAVVTFLNFLDDIINEKISPSLLCLKSIESLSKVSRRCLVSHVFNIGSRKSQDILCSSLLKLLLNSYLFPSDNPKRFYATYNRLIQSGIHESVHPLLITQRFLSIVKSVISTRNLDAETLLQMWSGIASPLVEVIEKTQDVNQGDKVDHDFSCMYEVLLCPIELIFPTCVQQFRTKPAFQLWSVLFKSFMRSASLVPTVLPNEICETFCSKLKNFLKPDLMKESHFFESVCILLQVVVETVDFTSFGATSSEGIFNSTLLVKQKKPLGNLTSLVDVLAELLKVFHSYYFEPDDANSSCTATNRGKMHVMKSAVPLELLRTFFGNIKFGNVIPFVLEILAEPLANIISASGNKKASSSISDSKFTVLWNLLTSTIEKHYLGPYDNDFLLVMSPLLEASFSHTKRNLKERSRRFWFATFGTSSSPLIFPESLKVILKKCKLPLLSDDIISPTDEFSATPSSEQSEDSTVHKNLVAEVQMISVFAKPFAVKNDNKNENPIPVAKKRSRISAKISIDDLPSEEFVKIDPPTLPVVTKRKSLRKRKSFVPSLYNDLSQSQDTSNFESHSDSQETNSVSSQEEPILENKTKNVADSEFESENIVKSVEENINSKEHQNEINVVEALAGSAMEVDDIYVVSSNEITEDKNLNVSTAVENTVETNPKINPEAKTSLLSRESELNSNNCQANSICLKDITVGNESKKVKLCEESCSLNNANNENISLSPEVILQKNVNTRKRKSFKLNNTFSFVGSDKKHFKEDISLKKSNSCIETIEINDSDEIIPSSQSSSENDNQIKLSFIESMSPETSNFKKKLISQNSSVGINQIKSSVEQEPSELGFSESPANATSTSPKSQKSVFELEEIKKEESVTSSKTSLNVIDTDNVTVDKFSNSVLEHSAEISDVSKTKNNVFTPFTSENEQSCASGFFNCEESERDLLNDKVTQNKNFTDKSISVFVKDDPDIEIIEIKSNSGVETNKKSAIKLSKKALTAANRRKSLSNFINNHNNINNSKSRRKSNIYESKVGNEKIDDSSSEISETPLLSNDVSDCNNGTHESLKELQDMSDIENEISTYKVLTAVIEDVCTIASNSKEISITRSSQNNVPKSQNVNIRNELITSNSKPVKYNLRNHKVTQMLENKVNVKEFSDLNSQSQSEFIIETVQVCDAHSQNDISNISFNSLSNKLKLNSLEVKQNDLSIDDAINVNVQSETSNIEAKESVCCINIEDVSVAESEKNMNVQKKESNAFNSKPESNIEPVITSHFTENKMIDLSIPNSDEKIDDEVQKAINSLIDDASKINCCFATLIDETTNCESLATNHMELLQTSDLNSNSLKESQEKLVEGFSESCPVFSEVMEDEENILSKEISCIISRLSPSHNANEQNDIDIQEAVELSKQHVTDDTTKEIPKMDTSENCHSTMFNDQQCNNKVGLQSSVQESGCDEDVQSVIFNENDVSSRNNSAEDNVTIVDVADFENNALMEFKIVDNKSSHTSLNLPLEIFSYNKTTCNKESKNDFFIESIKCNANEISMLVDHIISLVEIKELCTDTICSSDEQPLKLNYMSTEIPLVQNHSESRFVEDIQSNTSNFEDMPILNEWKTNDQSLMDFDQSIDKSNSLMLSCSTEGQAFEKGSKKRKAKPPVRSPFNFRSRTKNDIAPNEVSKILKPITKDVLIEIFKKSTKIDFVKSMKEDFLIEKTLSTSNVDKSFQMLDVDKVDLNNHSLNCKEVMLDYLQPSKGEMNNDELTNLHTRLNANTAPHTRRSQMIAAAHKICKSAGKQHAKTSEENFMKPKTTSILKKKDCMSSRLSSSKNRVTFADPLVHERIIEEGSKWNAVEICVVSDISQSDSKKRKKNVGIQKNKVVEAKEVLASTTENDDIPSSSEYQDSDTLADYSDVAVSPTLINCEDSISCILEDLTSPTWVRGLESLLISKNMKTIGDVCRLNIHELKALPFKSPKVLTLHNALLSHLDHTQKATLEKLNNIDDGCSNVQDNNPSSSEADGISSDQAEKMEESIEDLQSQSTESMMQEFLNQNKFNNLPTTLLTRIIEKCANVLTERLGSC